MHEQGRGGSASAWGIPEDDVVREREGEEPRPDRQGRDPGVLDVLPGKVPQVRIQQLPRPLGNQRPTLHTYRYRLSPSIRDFWACSVRTLWPKRRPAERSETDGRGRGQWHGQFGVRRSVRP
jgi:hypothetical protein